MERGIDKIRLPYAQQVIGEDPNVYLEQELNSAAQTYHKQIV